MTVAPRPRLMRIAVVALALMLSGGVAGADVLRVGEKLVELDGGVDDAGKAFRFKALHGKWVVVTIGASWCKPCKKELPTWDKLAATYGDKITFVAINVDEDPADGRRFNAALKLKHLKLVYLSPKAAAAARYGADTMPSTFVANAEAVVRFRKDGFQERDPDGEYRKLKAEIDRWLKPM
jgi:thiol-disulfide isomerase/thioredoxin